MDTAIISWLNKRLSTATNRDVGFTMVPAPTPYCINGESYAAAKAKYETICEFFDSALFVFRLALDGKLNPVLIQWLLNDTPLSWGSSYHNALHECHFTSPKFFRTDETHMGHVIEIQCPGSLWGEHQILWDYFNTTSDYCIGESLASQFSSTMASIANEGVNIHHLLDNASIPHSMEYFIQQTRPFCRYFGYDSGIHFDNCNFVRSHSFLGLMAQNETLKRIRLCAEGKLHFDLPPHVLFDQKAPICLPFWRETHSFFSERVRALFPYSQPISMRGFTLDNGEWITLKSFSTLPRQHRCYMLKYAGTDVSRNWGARAVFRLDVLGQEKCFELLEKAAQEVASGSAWMVQKVELSHEDVANVEPEQQAIISGATVKNSSFYGPNGYMGSLVMHRRFYKVHGNKETVVSIIQI